MNRVGNVVNWNSQCTSMLGGGGGGEELNLNVALGFEVIRGHTHSNIHVMILKNYLLIPCRLLNRIREIMELIFYTQEHKPIRDQQIMKVT